MTEKLNPYYKQLKAERPINILSKLKQIFDSVNKVLSVALKQLLPGKQLLLMADASLRSAGFPLLTEGNPDRKIQ